MRSINYSFLRTVCALVIGLVLTLFPTEAGNYLVITIGIVFIIPSLFSIISYFSVPRELKPRFPIEAVGGLLFGLWLVVTPSFFADLLTYLLGFILVMGGVQQLASLIAARRWVHVSGGFYIVPLLILLAGILAILNPTGTRDTAFIIIGITALVYAVSELINWFAFIRRRPKETVVPIKENKPEDIENNIDDAELLD